MNVTIGKTPLHLSLKDTLLIGVFALFMLVIGGPILLFGTLIGGLILALSGGQEQARVTPSGNPQLEQPSARVLHSKVWEHPTA